MVPFSNFLHCSLRCFLSNKQQVKSFWKCKKTQAVQWDSICRFEKQRLWCLLKCFFEKDFIQLCVSWCLLCLLLLHTIRFIQVKKLTYQSWQTVEPKRMVKGSSTCLCRPEAAKLAGYEVLWLSLARLNALLKWWKKNKIIISFFCKSTEAEWVVLTFGRH